MSDFDDLVELRRAFVAAEERLFAAGRALPPHAAVVAGEAEAASEEQRQAWRAAQDECRRLAVQIQTHPWWATVDSRQAAERALRDAAAERDDLDQVG
jgi:predicted phage gp36 major capsid-like protein